MSEIGDPLEKLRYGSTGPFMDGFARDLLNKDFSRRIICAHLRAATHLVVYSDVRNLA